MAKKRATSMASSELDNYISDHPLIHKGKAYSINVENEVRAEAERMAKENKSLPCVRSEGNEFHESCPGCDQRVKSFVKFYFLLDCLKNGHAGIVDYITRLKEITKEEMENMGIEVKKLEEEGQA